MAVEALPDPDFVDVRIVDIDLRRTTWSRVHESMRVVFLRLNRAPPDLDWTRLFNEERESRINLLQRELAIRAANQQRGAVLGIGGVFVLALRQ